jgi:hypothetical protein
MTNTIGMFAVAAVAARVARLPPLVVMISTPRCTRSSARAGSRSGRPSAKRKMIARFCPSTYPASLRPWTNARLESSGGTAV